MPLIDIRNVYKIYNPGENEVHALDGVTLKVEREEFVAIVGQSGSGKSTLMNMIGLLDSPTSGEYYLDDEDVSKLSDDKLSEIRNKQIGFIFQGFNLIPSLTAQANVELPLVYRGMAAQERHELSIKALERVGLGHRLDHRPSEMSGGQQQRVAIARAVAARPPVILADEPTGHGYRVVINHGNGLQTGYSHCKSGSIRVRVGQQVSRGQQVASIGSTGNSSGPHLHFEVIRNGTRVNPSPYIS